MFFNDLVITISYIMICSRSNKWGILTTLNTMNTIYSIYETFTNGYNTKILNLFSITSVLSGILVITAKNPVISVLFLISLFLSIASYLIILGISFIGLSYILVYVGAVSILFIFILMLINIRISELVSNTSNSIPLALIIAVSFNYTLYQILPYNITFYNPYTLNINKFFTYIWYSDNYSNYLQNNYDLINDSKIIYFVTASSWDGNIAECNHISSIGNIMYTSYFMWLILTSLILLLAMIGCIIITIKQKN